MKIEKIEGYVLSSPYGDGNVFGQPKGVKSIAIVEIHSDGLIGYGESYQGVYSPELFVNTVNFLSERIIGMDFAEYDKIMSTLNIPFVGNSGFVKSVIGAIDISLMDIKSQSLKLPLCDLLTKDSVIKANGHAITYASGGSVAYTKEQIKEEAERVKRSKFKYYKIRCGLQGIEKDIERIETALDIVGGGNLMVDFIQGTLKNLSTLKVSEYLNVLNKYQLYWIEEIVQPYDIVMLKHYSSESLNPFASGEHFTNEIEFDSVKPYVKFIQPDVTQCGGFYYTERNIGYVNTNKIAMHCWGSAVSFMANLHMALSTNAMMEQPLVPLKINDYLYKEDIYQYDGTTRPPFRGIGLNIYIDNNVKKEFKFVEGSGYKI